MIMVPKASKPSSSKHGAPVLIERFSEANVPTEYGTFRVVVYREHRGSQHVEEHVAMVMGDVRGEHVLVRVHS